MRDALMTRVLGPSLNLALLVLAAWSGIRVWEIATNSVLISQEAKGTLIQVDLLQLGGFFLAWSAFLVTVGSWVANFITERNREVDRLNFQLEGHLADHPETDRRVQEMENQVSTAGKIVEETLRESDQQVEELKRENEALKRQVISMSADGLY